MMMFTRIVQVAVVVSVLVGFVELGRMAFPLRQFLAWRRLRRAVGLPLRNRRKKVRGIRCEQRGSTGLPVGWIVKCPVITWIS